MFIYDIMDIIVYRKIWIVGKDYGHKRVKNRGESDDCIF